MPLVFEGWKLESIIILLGFYILCSEILVEVDRLIVKFKEIDSKSSQGQGASTG
jgi:hypothetical protein